MAQAANHSFLKWIEIYHPGVYPYLPTPPLGQDMTQDQFLSEV